MRLTTFSVDSSLGRWTHTEWRPPHLAALVERVWHFEGRTSLPRERSFPAGHLEIILHLGPRFRDVDRSGKTLGHFPAACVTGIQLAPMVIEAPAEPCCVLGIRLRAAGAYVLLGTPADLATDRTLDLADVVGASAPELTERCYAASTVEARFKIVARWIAERLACAPEAHPGIAWAAQQLEQHGGATPIADLRRETTLGNAKFVGTFRRQIGLSPKRYARVLRFQRALTLLRGQDGLAKAALAAGFYDQAHMNAEFREFAGMTPVEFAQAASYPNSASLAESAL
ncbi:MAG: AraC family transcriptional regulator [bacterium]